MTVASASTELTVVERAAVALDAPRHRTELAAMVENTKSITVVRNTVGREQVHAAFMRLKNARVAIQKVGKEARDDATKFSKAVIAEENSLIEIISTEELRLQTLRDEWDEARAEEKREAERKEAARQALIQEHIDDIKNIPHQAIGKTAAQINVIAVDLDFLVLTEDRFGKRLDEAKAFKVQALHKLTDMHDAAAQAEAAAALAAKQAEEDRIERMRIAEEQRVEATRLAALQREIDEKAAAARREQEERERVAAKARAEQDRIAQEKRDEEDRIAREKRAAAQKILDDQEAEIRRRQAEVDAQARADRLEAERRECEAYEAEQARLEAEDAERRRIAQEEDEARRAAEEAAHIAEQKVRDAAPVMLKTLEQIEADLTGPKPYPIATILARVRSAIAAATVADTEEVDHASV